MLLLLCLLLPGVSWALTAPTVNASDSGSFGDTTVWVSVPPQPGCNLFFMDVVKVGYGNLATGVAVSASGGTFMYTDTMALYGSKFLYEATLYGCSPNATGWDYGNSGVLGYTGVQPVEIISASDGTFSDRVRVTFTAPDQSPYCTSVLYTVMVNGTGYVILDGPLTGGQMVWDDFSHTSGTYRVDATCPTMTVVGLADTGFRMLDPPPPTAFTASDGTVANAVELAVSYPALGGFSSCAAVISRPGWSSGPVAIGLGGGTAYATDASSPSSIPATYSAYITCDGKASPSLSDTGYAYVVPLAPYWVAATDGDFTNRVNVSFSAPDQSALCSSASYIVSRDGADIASVTTVPVTGGTGSFDDGGATVGLHSYSVRAVCGPVLNTQTAGPSDTGFWMGTPAAPVAVAASDGAFPNKVAVTWSGPNQSAQCSSVGYNVKRDGVLLASITTVPVTGGAGSYDDTTVPPGNHTYTVDAVCSPGSAAAASAGDVGYALGMPAAATAVSASDGAFSDRVRITWTSPDQSFACTSISYNVKRDGAQIGTLPTVALNGGASSFDDLSASVGTHTYAVDAVCGPGSAVATSSADTGFKLGTPAAAVGVTASDGAFPNKVAVTFSAPDQSATCTNISYVVTRDGADAGTVSSIPLSGGSGSFDDTAVTPGVHTYGVKSVCLPGSAVTASASTDTGYKQGSPAPVTSVAATDGTFTNKIVVSFVAPDQTAACSSVSYEVLRDGALAVTLTTVPLSGGSTSVDDATAAPGTHTYRVRAVCSPGGSVVTAGPDSGYWQGTPSAPTGVSASDGAFPDRVRITFTAPDQSAQCTGINYFISRDGTDIGTAPVLVSGGSGTYDDLSVPAGVHTYAVRAACSPGTASAASAVSDTGFRAAVPAVATSVAATDGTFVDKVAISFTAPNQAANCTSTSYVVTRDGVDLTTITTIPNTGGSGSYDDTSAAVGTHTYGVRSVCSPGNVSASSPTDTGYWLACAPPMLVGPQGTGPIPAILSWSSDPGAVLWVLNESTSAAGPFTAVATLPAGTTSRSVPGWPHMYYRLDCAAANPLGSKSSAVMEVWGDPPPSVMAQSFVVGSPGSASITPVITDPDGNTTFTLNVSSPPAHGNVSIAGAQFVYTPTAGYAGSDTFTITATDPGGQSGSADMTANVVLLPPGTPSNVAATDGTLVNQVNITWGLSVNSLGYRVFKSSTSSDPSPVQIADVGGATSSYSDTSATAGAQAFYSVQAYNGPQVSPRSVADGGYADTPITGLSASGATDPGTPVDLAPSYTDPDPGDVPTFAIVTQPAQGTAGILGGQVRYVPSGLFVGTDTFTIKATDRANQTTTGVAVVVLDCIPPALGGLAAGPGKIFVNGGLSITAQYNTGTCPQTFAASYRLLQGTTVVDSAALASVPAGSAQPIRFDRAAPAAAGPYTAEVTLTNTRTGAAVVKTVSFSVSDFRAPGVAWDRASPVQDLDSLTLSVGTSPDCAITTDPVAAQNDLALCLVEPMTLPDGLSNSVQGPPSWKWTGVPTTAGVFATTVKFSVFDSVGTKRVIASINKPVDVVALNAIVFTAPSTLSVKQYIDLFAVAVTQSGGPPCQLAQDVATAASQAAAGTRSCVLDWARPLPPDMYVDGTTLKGSVFDLASRSVAWTVSAVDGSGGKHPTTSGTTAIVPLATNLAFDLSMSPSAPYAQVTPVTIAPKSIGGDTCGVTALESMAMASLTRRCLFEFGTVAGLAQPVGISDPQLRGTLPTSPLTTIPYTVSVFVDGVKHQVVSGSKDMTTQAPMAPSIAFEHVREIGPDTYAVSVLGGAIGVVSTSTDQGQVDGSAMVAGDPAATLFTLVGAKNKRVLYATAAELYAARTLDVSVALTAVPSFSSSKQVTLVAVPRDGLRLRLDSPPKVITDTSVLTVSASVVQPTASGLVYVPADAGPWVISFGEMGSNGVFNALTPDIPIDPATGQATATVPIGTNTILRLTARARAVSSYAGYTATLTSPTQVISIVKGTPISGSLAAVSATTGPAPMLGVMKVVFDTLADHAANVSVVWSRSEDNGLTWTPITTATGLQYAERMAAGVHLYKVQFTNRNTQETSESAPLQMEAYDVPSLTIEGPGYLLPNNSASYAATALNPDGSPMTGALYEWSLAVATTPTSPLATGAGNSIAYTATDVGVYRLTVRSRAPGTSATDPSAWKQTIKQIVVASPTRPVARISGPLRVEVGKPATFTANVATTFSLASTNLTLGGQWTLPDGTTVPGTTLTWTPTAADLAASSRPVMTYTAWVVGYEGQTTYSTTSQLTLWQYVWPSWKLAAAQGGTVAPANAQFTAIPDNALLVGTLEGLTYTWTVPGQLRVIGTPTSKLTGIVDYGGTYTAQVVVSDARGNSTSLSADVTMIDAPPMVVDLVAQNLSKWSHAPILLGVTTKATGGHPLDAVTSWTYTLDGTPQALPNQSTARFSLDSPGTYNVRVDISTKMGATANKTVVVNVPPNTAPSCAPTGVVATNRRSIALKANCTDADGLISRYTWAINGVPVTLSVGAAWTAYLPADQAWPVTVDVNATDDAGAMATGSATFN